MKFVAVDNKLRKQPSLDEEKEINKRAMGQWPNGYLGNVTFQISDLNYLCEKFQGTFVSQKSLMLPVDDKHDPLTSDLRPR